jgi:mRNA-degrading endonuclease RelE of RelBE toxin-antitoxin system
VTVTDPPLVYGVVKDDDVISFLRERPASASLKLRDAIDELQHNPRPPAHTAAHQSGLPLTKLTIDSTSPNYTLIYRIDDNRYIVYVIAITETVTRRG